MTTADDATASRRPPTRRYRGLFWKALLVGALVAAGLWTATHGIAGVAWKDVGSVLRAVPVRQLALLAAIWVGGLGIYATVLSAALPGLGIRRSLLLNLSGSAVANVVPLGGAVATGLNWRMVRRWGHSDSTFVTYCVLTNALDVATKLLLPVVAVAGLAALSVHVPAALWYVASSCAVVLLLALFVLLVLPPVLGRGDDPGAARGWPAVVRSNLHETTARIHGLLSERWPRLIPASALYIAAQVALMLFSLRAVGLDAPVTVVLMAAAIERLGSLVPLTPGGTGLAEIGTIAWLVGNGLDPVEVVAGVLLYRVFLIAMEIPVGGVLLGAWAWLQRTSPRASLGGAI